MKLASILRDLISKLFGRDKSKQITAPQPVTEVRNAEGSCNGGSSTTTTVIMIETPEDEDALSRKEVMKMIKAMVKTEDKQKPYYDTEILAALQKGDLVVTSSGLHGKVFSVDDDEVVVEIADKVRVTIDKSAVKRKNDAGA